MTRHLNDRENSNITLTLVFLLKNNESEKKMIHLISDIVLTLNQVEASFVNKESP